MESLAHALNGTNRTTMMRSAVARTASRAAVQQQRCVSTWLYRHLFEVLRRMVAIMKNKGGAIAFPLHVPSLVECRFRDSVTPQ